jgi:uncharacterized protein (TIGR00106 family)
MSAMAFFSITPLGKGESVSKYVARVVNSVKQSGLEWKLTPMGTIVEGDSVDDVFSAISNGIKQLDDCNRLSISIKIDYRKDRKSRMKDKVESVIEKL